MNDLSFVRLAAVALIFAGAVMVMTDATHLGVHFLGEGEAEPALDVVATHPLFIAHGVTHVVFGLLLMLGIAGIMVRYAPRLGRLGLGVALVAFVGQGLSFALYYLVTFGAAAAPEAFLAENASISTSSDIAFVISFLSGILGLVALGVVLAWRNLLSRLAGIVVAIATVLFVGVDMVPAGFEAVVGIAVAWLGVRFWQDLHRGAPAVTKAPAAVSQ